MEDTVIISGPIDMLREMGFAVDGAGDEEEVVMSGTKGKKLTAPPRRVKAKVLPRTKSRRAGGKQRTVPPSVRISIGGHASASVTGQIINLPPLRGDVWMGLDLHYVSGPQCSLTDIEIGREKLVEFNTRATAGGTAGASVASEIDLAGEADTSGGPIVYRFWLNPDSPAEGQDIDDAIPVVTTWDGGVSAGAEPTIFNARIWKDTPKYGDDVKVIVLNA